MLTSSCEKYINIYTHSHTDTHACPLLHGPKFVGPLGMLVLAISRVPNAVTVTAALTIAPLGKFRARTVVHSHFKCLSHFRSTALLHQLIEANERV